MKQEQNFIKLKTLIKKVFGVKHVDYSTEVNKLNTLSEDNDRFIMLLESEFNVDMSSFPYYQYFEEDEFILFSLFKRLFRIGLKDKKSLTVTHLLKVIENGRWCE